ncbi:unconventional myosin-XVIIIb-like isoform X1 [Corythoichthys intestinalis]|uniref:unconventional myosin-XVIIIb-like isoform X1 n=1 Tax=Corythoichthys intestinalis TaxID=161448 RepID=UPI0025A5A8DD|nr:unconventional myosin-XVIIIb-like isoform X1 [Corythoichthys intestinalis]
MALSSRLKLWEKKIQEENHPVAALVPPPPLSTVPGGFLKQLVRDSEKETRQKEPDIKEEKTQPSKLSDNLVQQFLLPDQTPPILEAEMLLRAEKRGPAQSPLGCTALPEKLEIQRELAAEPSPSLPDELEGAQARLQEVTQKENSSEERQEPEGMQADAGVTEERGAEVKDVWYEAGPVWYAHKDGFAAATLLKPDEGTPELPQDLVRLRLLADGSRLDVPQSQVDKCNPAHLDLCEDLSELHSVNESSVLHTLIGRANANMPITRAGPDLVNFWPPQNHGKTPRWRRGQSWRDTPPSALAALAKQAYVSAVDARRDHCICAIGRSGTGKTAACQAFAVALLQQAGTAGPNVSVKRVAATFTVLKSFGCVTSPHSDASSRFATLFSLDFNHAGRVAAGHLQTMMLEKWRVCHTTPGESNFLVFSQMLAGLGTELRTELQLHLHQLPEHHSFGMVPPTKAEEKQRASTAFAKLSAAMDALDFSAGEQKSIWHVLAGIYHLGAASACKVGRRQFLNFDSAQAASAVLGCEGEELQTAVFKHHLGRLLRQSTGRERDDGTRDGPRLTAAQCVDGMASGLYEELFTAIVSLINRSLGGQQLALASVTVVDTPGLRNPRHSAQERAAELGEFCHNYLQERLLEHRYAHAFVHSVERYAQENVPVEFQCPDVNPADTVAAIDQPPPQVAAGDAPRGLLWALDEEMSTAGSDEGAALERVCRHYDKTVRQCEQALHCEVGHLTGNDAVRYDLSGWFGVLRDNPAASNAAALLRDSNTACIKSMFGASARASLAGVCGLEGWSQRSLQRSSTIRKTLSGGAAALRRHSPCVAIKLQADAMVNVIRRARPIFLQCVSAKMDGAGAFDINELRTQLKAAQTLAVLRAYRAGYPDHMTLSDFRCRFQALSPPVMERYASVFVSHDERKAVNELLADLDQDPKSTVVGASRVFMKRGVLRHLEAQRDLRVTGWLVRLQAACVGHLARHKYRTLKVQHMAVRCLQRNLRVMRAVSEWSWWKLFCRARPLLDVNMDNERLRAKEDEVSALRRRLEKSEKERNDLRQTADACETKLTAVTSELSDERFRGDAAAQALDAERAERLRLGKESKDLRDQLSQCKVAMETLEKKLEEDSQKIRTLESQRVARTGTESELALQLECCQTEVDFLRRRLQQTEEKTEAERQARQQADAKAALLQTQLDESKRAAVELKRHNRRVADELHDAKVMMDSLHNRTHELERKRRRFDGELAAALEEAEAERESKDKTLRENAALGVQIFTLRRELQESRAEADRLREQKDELCCQIRDLSVRPGDNSLPELKKKVRHLEAAATESTTRAAELTASVERQQQVHVRAELEMARVKQMHQKELEDKDEELEDVHRSSQRRLRQLEMQLEQEYEEKQMLVHEKHDLEGLVATLCEQVGHRDFDVEKKLRRDLKRTHALLADAQTMLESVRAGRGDGAGPEAAGKEQLERLHCQLEESESRRREMENAQSGLTQELEDLHLQLENICKQKNLADDELAVLRRENGDLLKRLDEDQDDLNQLMKKHKALIAQSSSDIGQIRELQAELEDAKKQRHALQEELRRQASRLQFVESSSVGRSIVSKQEARVCDLENKLEFTKGQVKRLEVVVVRLRDSVVRLGAELEQSAQSEARERENARYFQQRLQDARVEMDELSQRHQDAARRRVELEMQVEELMAIRQTLQADLETSIRRIVDLQAALEEVRSSDDSDTDRESSVGSVGTEDERSGREPTEGRNQSVQEGRRSVADSCSSFCSPDPGDSEWAAEGPRRAASSSALSELLEGLRKQRAGGEAGGTVSLPVYQTTAASTLRRRASALSLAPEQPVGILKPSSPLLPRAASALSVNAASQPAPSCFNSCDSLTSPPSLPRLSSLQLPSTEGPSARRTPSPAVMEEESLCPPSSPGRSPRAPRRCVRASLLSEDPSEVPPPTEGVVFQNRRLMDADATSDILPAIRRPRSASGRRALSVHFGDLPHSPRRRGSSDAESSGSRGSAASGESARLRRRAERPRGDRLEAEGSEGGGDVAAVMRKYLNKERQ